MSSSSAVASDLATIAQPKGFGSSRVSKPVKMARRKARSEERRRTPQANGNSDAKALRRQASITAALRELNVAAKKRPDKTKASATSTSKKTALAEAEASVRRRRRRFRPGTRARMEIVREMKSKKLAIPRACMNRLIREVLDKCSLDADRPYRLSAPAYEVIAHESERMLTCFLNTATHVTAARRRATLTLDDLRTALATAVQLGSFAGLLSRKDPPPALPAVAETVKTPVQARAQLSEKDEADDDDDDDDDASTGEVRSEDVVQAATHEGDDEPGSGASMSADVADNNGNA